MKCNTPNNNKNTNNNNNKEGEKGFRLAHKVRVSEPNFQWGDTSYTPTLSTSETKSPTKTLT